ncbi:MAG: PKD domain-containing protein [Flavobacteriales bacterium]
MQTFYRAILFFSLAFYCCLHALAHQPKRLEYVKNNGQWHPNVKHRVAMQNGAVFMETGCITYAFTDPLEWAKTHEYNQWTPEQKEGFSVPAHAWRMRFLGNNAVAPVGEEIQSHYYNYFNGNDASKWAGHVPVYHATRYPNLYDGIDLRASSSLNHFKFDFIVKAGKDPGQIRYTFTGQESISLADGQLVIQTSVGEFRENAPYAFQLVNGQLHEVECHYAFEDGEVRFVFPNDYDHSRELIIDPELIAATLSGTNVTNYGHAATFDNEGSIYTGCISFGVGYPTSDGAFQENFGGGGTDFGISKLDPEGINLIWASYVGGNDSENPHSMIANDLHELYVYGSTTSSDFPALNSSYDDTYNGGADIVVVKFSEDGSQLIGSTFIGGSDSDGQNQAAVNYGDTYRGEIILDNNQEPLIASFSSSDDFPVTNGAYQSENAGPGSQDVVVFRLNSNLSILEVSTYLGSEEPDTGFAVRQAANGNIYVAGMAGGADFPVTAGAYQTTYLGDINNQWAAALMDGFVACFNSNLSALQYCTFLATEEQDEIFFMDLDNDDNVFVYGQGGVDMPIVGDVYSVPNSTQFIVKFNAQLSDVMLGTQIGLGDGGGDFGGFDFVPVAFLVDHCNNIYISSYSAWGSLPLVEELYNTGGFYLAVFTENLEELEFATMYSENHVDGGTSRFDKNGTVYQGVCSGGGFTTTPDAWATNQSSGWDIGVFKIDFDVSGVNSAISGSDIVGCAPFQVNFSNFSTGDTFDWDFGDGATSTEYEPSHIYEDPGVYEVSLIATDSLSCNIADTSFFDIVISVPVDYVPSFTYSIDCSTQSIECINTTGYDFLSYTWTMGDGTIIEDENAEHLYLEPGTYDVTLTAEDEGCLSDSTITQQVTIFNEVVAVIGNDDAQGCAPYEVEFENNSGGVSFVWDFGDGTLPVEGQNVSHVFANAGEYVVTLYAYGNSECPGTDTTFSAVTVIQPDPIESFFIVQQIEACELLHIETDNQSTGADLDYTWYIDGEMIAGTENISDYLDLPGTYTITLEISEPVCDQVDDFSDEVVVIDQIDLQLQPDIPICYYDDQIVIQAVEPGPDAQYLWSTDEITSAIAVANPGQYIVEVNWNNCEGRDTVNVTMIPAKNLITDVNFCEGSSTYLTIPFEGSESYTWCNGQTGQNITTDQDGQYCYEFIDNQGCVQEGLINVYMQDYMASVYIPNAFTPNNDGINDVFLAQGVDVAEFEMEVWNRWGDQVFKSNSIEDPWIGNAHQNGEYYVPDGVYTYAVTYRGQCSSDKIEAVGYIVVTR